MDTAQVQLLKDCFQKQIAEMDMLSSIYCSSGEFQFQGHDTVADFNEYLSDKPQLPRSKLDYIICLNVGESGENRLEVHVVLPHLYPALEAAEITLRSADFNRTLETLIKQQIDDYIAAECDTAETYVYQVLVWIQDRLESFKELQGVEQASRGGDSERQPGGECELERLWIYSHHIKSKTKRQNIVRIARDLDLTGFMRPGKPGIICVEGLKEGTQEFWRTIKQWNWHKITVKVIESKKKAWASRRDFNRFEVFREEMFTDDGEGDEVPMSMSRFMKFLETHNSSYVKKDLFGFE